MSSCFCAASMIKLCPCTAASSAGRPASGQGELEERAGSRGGECPALLCGGRRPGDGAGAGHKRVDGAPGARLCVASGDSTGTIA